MGVYFYLFFILKIMLSYVYHMTAQPLFYDSFASIALMIDIFN